MQSAGSVLAVLRQFLQVSFQHRFPGPAVIVIDQTPKSSLLAVGSTIGLDSNLEIMAVLKDINPCAGDFASVDAIVRNATRVRNVATQSVHELHRVPPAPRNPCGSTSTACPRTPPTTAPPAPADAAPPDAIVSARFAALTSPPHRPHCVDRARDGGQLASTAPPTGGVRPASGSCPGGRRPPVRRLRRAPREGQGALSSGLSPRPVPGGAP